MVKFAHIFATKLLKVKFLSCNGSDLYIKDNNFKRKALIYGRNISRKYPRLTPILLNFKKFFFKPHFSGWGMTSEHDLPWSNGLEGEIFRKASIDLKNSFKFNRATIETYPKNL